MQHGRGNDEFWYEGARHAHEGWWGGPLHLILFVLFVALLVVGAVWIVRRLVPAAAPQPFVPAVMPAGAAAAHDPAVAALRMRYASGEVSREDFQQRMDDLAGGAGSGSSLSDSGEDTAPTAS